MEDGGPQEETFHLGRLTFQYLLGQVVDQVPLVAYEVVYRFARVRMSLEREGGQVQYRRPTLRARQEVIQVLASELEP